jgi:hypothetical protein
MPYWAASLAMPSMSGGSVAGGGISSCCAGSESVHMKFSKPAGSVTSRKRACSELTVNVCGMFRGP